MAKVQLATALRTWASGEMSSDPDFARWLADQSILDTFVADVPEDVESPVVDSLWLTCAEGPGGVTDVRVRCNVSGEVYVSTVQPGAGYRVRQVGRIDMSTGEWIEQLSKYHLFVRA